MLRFRLAVLPATVLALAFGTGRFLADDKDKGDSAKKYDHLERLSVRLKLDDKQKDALRKIESEFDTKADPVEHQIWALHHQEHEAMQAVLTPEQRARVPEFFRGLRDQEMKKIADELKLNDDQRGKIGKICESYEPKFKALAAEKETNENVHKQFRELRHQMIREIRADLDEQQRDQLPAIVREEHHFWRNAESRREHYKELGEKLGVTTQQKEQFSKIREQYDPKIKELHAELKKLHQEEYAAMEKVLTEEQRAKWKEMHKGGVRPEKSE